jgi:hypothetical protein
VPHGKIQQRHGKNGRHDESGPECADFPLPARLVDVHSLSGFDFQRCVTGFLNRRLDLGQTNLRRVIGKTHLFRREADAGLCHPANRPTTFSIRAAQEAQVIPAIGMITSFRATSGAAW